MRTAKQKGRQKRGFKIQPAWHSWDKEWFERAGKNSEKLRRNRERYNSHEGNIIGFVRTIGSLHRLIGLDLPRFVDPLIDNKKTPGPADVLDSGAGFGFISAGLKLRHGSKVRITALGWEELPSPKQARKMIDEELKTLERKKGGEHKLAMDVLLSARDFLPQYARMRGKMKSARVFFENFVPGKQYDLILDLTGPVMHTAFHTRTLEQIFNLLKPNGTAILWCYTFTTKQAFELLNPFGAYAQETGYYLKLRQNVKQFDILKKVPVTKKSVAPKRKREWGWSLRND